MRNLFIVFALLLGSTSISFSQNHLPDSTYVKLREYMQGFKDRYHAPSITVVMVHDQDIVFGESLGYADLEKQIPASIHSIYPIMSVTKVFTATMLMQLKEEGKITFDDQVMQYVPEFKSPSTSRITLLQLATHTSGLPRNPASDIHFAQQVDQWLMRGGNDTTITRLASSTTKELLKSLAYVESEYPAYHLMRYGDRHYSNLGYSLLGIALERAAKTDYVSYITQHIFSPLKMDESGFLTDPSKQNKIVPGYWYNSSTDRFMRAPVYEPKSMMPAGGIYSTAADLAKFLSFQFRNNNSPEINNILSNDSKSMMMAFNIGWKPAYPFVMHEGAMLGHRCVLCFNPDLKIGWVILTNTTDFDFSRVNTAFAQLITPLYEAKPVTDLSRYVGTYHLKGGYGSLKIYQEGNDLYSTYLSDILPKTPLIPLGGNRFNEKAGDAYTVGYEFLFNNPQKVVLNLGQLMWVKE